MKTFKPLTPVKVIHEKSKFFGKVGRVINANNKAVVVDFGDKVFTTLLRWQIEPTTKYTDKLIKSEALEKVGNELQQIKDLAQSEIERYSKYNTNEAVEGAACCKRFLALINAVLHDNTI